MEWRGVKKLRAVACAVCAVAGAGGVLPAAAALLPNLAPGSTQDAQEAADLADAHSDSPVLRALSSMPSKAAADKAATPEPRTDTAPKPANPASATKPEARPLGETVHMAAKDLAVSTGAVDARQYLSTEFGSDKAPDGNADPEINVLRRRANGDTRSDAANANNAPARSAEQMKLDEEQASFLASALVHEVMPWALGAAMLVGCAQGLRAMLAFSRRKSERRRRHRKSSSTRNARL
ncbi:hypothetical protein [Rhodoferax sp. WC2427]|uniref:hypothetical protein n=1 Tax=Rhodoferax sp. WC2427 TaxID=3234144 RepID=UPI0034651A8E